jgi:hypothetical protein
VQLQTFKQCAQPVLATWRRGPLLSDVNGCKSLHEIKPIARPCTALHALQVAQIFKLELQGMGSPSANEWLPQIELPSLYRVCRQAAA